MHAKGDCLRREQGNWRGDRLRRSGVWWTLCLWCGMHNFKQMLRHLLTCNFVVSVVQYMLYMCARQTLSTCIFRYDAVFRHGFLMTTGYWHFRFCTEQYDCYKIQTSAFKNSQITAYKWEWIGLIIGWYSSSTSFRGLQGGDTGTSHCHSTARDHQSPALWLQRECHSVLLDLQWLACEGARRSWWDPWCPNQCGCGSRCVTTTICAGDHGGRSREQWNISVQSSVTERRGGCDSCDSGYRWGLVCQVSYLLSLRVVWALGKEHGILTLISSNRCHPQIVAAQSGALSKINAALK